MDETREQYLERIINGSTAYINVKERREELHYVKHSLRKRFEGSILLGI